MTRMPTDMPAEWYFQAALAHPEGSKERLDYEWTGRRIRDAWETL